MGIDTVRYTDMCLRNPVGIVGFPSVGLVSSIAANYIVAQLDMEPVAGLGGDSMPPYCMVSDGLAYPPIRLYGRRSTTKTGRDLVVCTSEYAPKPEDCYTVATAVMGAMRDTGCSDVICLEGIPRTSPEDVPVACGCLAEASGLRTMDSGMIKGLSGVMMYQAPARGMTVTTVLCPANPSMPDPGAAIGFIDPLKRMVRGLKVNTKELEAEDEEIRRKLEAAQAVAANSENSSLYG